MYTVQAQDDESLLSVITSDTCNQYCRPGVEGMTPGRGLAFGVELLPNLSFTGEDGRIQPIRNSRRYHARLRIPLVLKDHFKLLAGVNYSNQEFNFSKNYPANVLPSELQNRSLKSSGGTVYLIRSLNHKFYLGGRASLSFNGDYNGLVSANSENIDGSLALLLGWKSNPNTEYGLGLAQGFWNGDYSLIPLFLFNYSRKQFGVEAILPAEAYARYNFSPNSVLYAGLEYFGEDYMLNANYLTEINTPIVYDHNAVRFQTNFEQRLFPWVWADLKVGYQWSLGFDVLAIDQQPVIANDVDGSFYGGLELSIRPPRDFGK